MTSNSRPYLLTAGSGPSYIKWPHWPTWTKMVPMYFDCEHVDVSGPAAGNKFIARSIINEVSNKKPDYLVVQWNHGRLDMYLESYKTIKNIITSRSQRNFIIDPDTCDTTQGPGYWCSSFDNTVAWKRYYNKNIYSKTGAMLDDLEHMLLIQNLCTTMGIEYYFIEHSKFDHEFAVSNKRVAPMYKLIDWTRQLTNSSLAELARLHPSYSKKIRVPGFEKHQIPGPEFQFALLDTVVAPALKQIPRRYRHQELKNAAKRLQQKLEQSWSS